MNAKSVGLIELSSIAAGFSVADAALKAGDVREVMVNGKPVVATGVEVANGCLIDHIVISNLHKDVFTAIGRTSPVEPNGALGVIESFNVATLIKAADAAAKAADITLLEIRLAMALGGKAFATMTGDVSSVQAAVAAARNVIADAGVLVNAVVISRPHPDVYREVI